MRKIYLTSVACLLLAGTSMLVSSCQDEAFINTQGELKEANVPFSLVATNGAAANTRLSLDEDAVTLKWEDGDQLIMLDTQGKQSPIILTTSLSAPATTATFVSDGGVPAGTYVVVNKSDRNNSASMTGNLNYNLYKQEQNYDIYDETYRANLNRRSEVGNLIDLYSEPITITDQQTQATISLKHVYAELTFELQNFPAMNNSTTNGYESNFIEEVGLMSPSVGFSTTATMQQSSGSIAQSNEKYPNLRFRRGRYHDPNNTMGNIEVSEDPADVHTYSTLILPTQMNTRYYVYVVLRSNGYNYSTSTSYDNKYTVYEFSTDAIAGSLTNTNFEAGKRYAYTLDFTQARELPVPTDEISTVEQFRALAYYHPDGASYRLANDLNFSTETDFLPLYMETPYFPSMGYLNRRSYFSLNGQKHCLKNITINWPYDNAGLIRTLTDASLGVTIKDLTLENIKVAGKKNVGALFGYYQSMNNNSKLQNITITGTSTINGTNCVGGLIGRADYGSYSEGDIANILIGSSCTIAGKDSVGGLFGVMGFTITKCFSAATVNGDNGVGGIAGVRGGMDPRISKCGSSATVTAQGSNVGGIIGTAGSCENYMHSTPITLSYNIGNVTGTTNVGGIAGYGFSASYCCSLGNITSSTGNVHTGAIVGDASYSVSASTMYPDVDLKIKYCYSAGNVSSNFIVGYSNSGSIENCVTTLPDFGGNETTISSQVNCNADKTIESLNNIFNPDNFYSTALFWESAKDGTPSNLDALKCPKFKWQEDSLEGGTEAPGIGNGNI